MPPPKQKRKETASERLAIAPSAEDMSIENDTKRKRVQSKNRFKFRNLKERSRVASGKLSRAKLAESDTFDKRVERRGEDTKWHWQDELRLLHQDIDQSQLFREFYHSVASKSATLPLLLHHLKDVVSSLVAYTSSRDRLSEENHRSFLKLTGLLAKDIRKDLAEYVPDILKSLVGLVDEASPERTANVMKCISVVFANVTNTNLSVLKPFYPSLLGHRKHFIREFSAKAFASALRRGDSKNVRSHLKHVLISVSKSDARQNPDLRDGLSMLIFETLKNVGCQFHSKHIASFPALLRLLKSSSDDDKKEEEELLYDVITKVSARMKRYTDATSCEKVWKAFHSVSDRALSEEGDDVYAAKVIQLISDWVSQKRGSLVNRNECKRLKTMISNLFTSSSSTTELRSARLHLLAMSWIALFPEDDDENTHPLLKTVLNVIDSVGKRIEDAGETRDAIMFLNQLQLPIWATPRIQNSLPQFFLPRFCHSVCTLISRKKSQDSLSDFLFLLLKLCRQAKFDSKTWTKVLKTLSTILDQRNNINTTELWTCFACVQQQQHEEKVSDKIKNIFQTSLDTFCAKEKVKNNKTLAVECARACAALSSNIISENIRKWLQDSPSCPFALRAALYCLPQDFDVSHITSNLSSTSQVVRLRTLRLLKRLNPNNNMIADLLYIERHGRSPMEERNIRARTENIGAQLKSKQISNEDVLIMIKHVVGLINIRYSRLWPSLQKLLHSTSSHYFNLMWPVLQENLEKLIYIDLDHDSKKRPLLSNDNEEKESLEIFLKNQTLKLEFADRQDLGSENNEIDEISPPASKRTAILLDAMQMFSNLTETKNRYLVSLFFRCVRNEFSRPALMSQDPDAWDLVSIAYLNQQQEEAPRKCGAAEGSIQSGSERINSFLRLFSSFRNLKASFESEKLYEIFRVLLAKSSTCNAALDCILAFRRLEIRPYTEFLTRLADPDTRREEMALFSLTVDVQNDEEEEGNKRALRLESSHRKIVVPLVINIVYGLLSQRKKKGKGARGGTALAQRNSLVTFLSSLHPDEIEIFLCRLTRVFDTNPLCCSVNNFLPDASQIKTFLLQQQGSHENNTISKIQKRLAEHNITVTRQVAFLNTCVSVVQCLSQVLVTKLHIILKPVIAILKFVQDSKSEISNEDRSRLRQLSFKLLAEIWERYPNANWKQYSPFYMSILKDLVWKLPRVVSGGTSVPSLMKALRGLSTANPLWFHFVQGNFMEPLVKCLSVGYDETEVTLQPANDSVVNVLFDILENLTDDMKTSPLVSSLEVVLRHFHIRFSKSSQRGVAASKMVRSAFALRSLRLLAHLGDAIASKIQDRSDLVLTASKLVELLMPFLEPAAECSSDVKVYILRVIAKIVPHLKSSELVSPIPALIRLLSPGKGFDTRDDRVELTCTISNMLSDNTLIEMNAYEENKLNNEYDFERRTAAFNRINKGEFKTLLTENPDVLEAVLRHYMWSLRDPETLMRRFAATGVSRILRHISDLASRENNDSTQNMIRVFVRNIVFPGLRVWLQDYKTSEVIRRELLVLLTEAISLFEKLSDHASLHGDLACLCRPNDIEADFWRNLLHTQLHRRIRALRRMAESIQNGTCTPTTFSVVHLLFPMVMQFVNEYFTHKYAELRVAAYGALPILGRCLRWNKYVSTISSLLRTPRGPLNAGGMSSVSRERARIQAVCALLDAFDAFRPEDWSQGEKILNSLEKKLLPLMLSKLINKNTNEENEFGEKVKSSVGVVNIPIALALVKLLRCLPKEMFQIHVDKAFRAVSLVLRSRSQITRDDARKTLVQMAINAGPETLPLVISRLRDALKSGYQIHVLGFTVHAVLQGMESVLEQRVEQHEEEEKDDEAKRLNDNSPIWKALPDLVDVVEKDLFGSVARQRQNEGFNPNVRMREMRSCRSFETFQLLCRFIPFLPSEAFGIIMRPVRRHIVALDPMRLDKDAPILTTQEQRKQLTRIREVLRHGIRGLSKNPTVRILPLLHLVHSLLCEHFRIGRRMAAAAAAAASNNDSDSSDDDDEDSDNENQLSFDAEVDVILNSSKSSSSTQSNSSNGKSKQTRIAKSKGVGAWLVSAPREKIDPRDRSATKLLNAVVLPEPRLTGIDQDRRSGSFYKKKKPEEVVRIDIDQVGLGQHGYVMVQFAVSLLHMFLKKNRIRKDIHLEMIDPLIPLLTICCRKAHSDELLLSSLRCICAVANWPLPSLLKYSDTITSQVMSVLIRFGTNAAADVAQGCFRTLAVILKNKTWNVKPHQQKVLLSLLQTGAELPKKQKASFELIHTIVAKKIVSIEIYGLMDRLQEVLLESQHDVVRSSCSDILIRYLVNYPLSKKRLEAHLNFFLKNLDFTYESGRISMLSLLRNIVHRFPVPLLNEQSRIIFLPLVLRIANDEAAKVRAQASECIQELFTRCGDEACRKMIDLLMQWLRPRNADTAQTHLLRRTSTQVIGLIAQKRFGLVRSHRKEIVQCFTSILSRAVSCFKSDNDEMSTSLSRASDRDAYHVLTAFQRLIMTNSDLMIPEILKSKDSTIDAIMESMLAPHAWVRLKSSCVLGTIYSKRDPKQVNKCRYFLGKSGTIFELVRRTCRQLMSTMLTEIMSEQIVKNAVFLGQCMFYHPELCYEAASQDVVVEGEENDDNNNDDDETQRHQHKPVRWMFRRMGVLARRGKGQLTHATSIRQQASFRWFAAMSMTLPPNETKDYLPLMLSPLGSIVSASERAEAAAQLTSKVRTKDKRNKKRKRGGEEESEKPRTPHDITVSLGREVLDLLQNRYGDEIYLEAYGNTMKRIKEARASRKRERALEKVMHPDLHAERKRKKHKRENENRKRKIAEMKQRS